MPVTPPWEAPRIKMIIDIFGGHVIEIKKIGE